MMGRQTRTRLRRFSLLWFKDGLRPEARRHQPPSVVSQCGSKSWRGRGREAGAAARARAESKRRDVSHPSPCRKWPALPLSAVATASFFSRSDDDQIGKLKGIIVRLLEPPRTERPKSAKTNRRRKRGEPSNYTFDFLQSIYSLRYLYRQNTLREWKHRQVNKYERWLNLALVVVCVFNVVSFSIAQLSPSAQTYSPNSYNLIQHNGRR
jgi:hypothetical protein